MACILRNSDRGESFRQRASQAMIMVADEQSRANAIPADKVPASARACGRSGGCGRGRGCTVGLQREGAGRNTNGGRGSLNPADSPVPQAVSFRPEVSF